MLLQLANHYEATGQTARLLRLAQYSEQLLREYLDQVPVIFAYRRADNPENQRRGIVGQNSGFRQGVRNPNFIPAEHRARTKGTSTKYYDLGRQAWRSWRPGNVITVTAFWSVEEGKYVDTPEEAGIVEGAPFTAAPLLSPKVNEARIKRNATREATRKEREKTAVRRALKR